MGRKANGGAVANGNGAEFHLDEFLPYRLSVAAGRVSRLFGRRYAEAFGLSIPEWRVLTVVGRFSSISPSAVTMIFLVGTDGKTAWSVAAKFSRMMINLAPESLS